MLKDEFGIPIPIGALGDTVTVSLGVTAQRATLNPGRCYRIQSSVDCFVKQGEADVTATTSDAPLTAKQDYYLMTGLRRVCVSGIVSTGSGVLSITELILNHTGA